MNNSLEIQSLDLVFACLEDLLKQKAAEFALEETPKKKLGVDNLTWSITTLKQLLKVRV